MAISSFRRLASRKFFAGDRLADFLDQGNWNFYSVSANSSEKSQEKKLRMGPQEMLEITGNAADKERELLVATDMKENGICSVYKFESTFDPSIRPSLELHLNKRSWICCQALDNYKKTVHFPTATSLDGILRTQHRFFGSTAAKVKRNPLFSTIVSDDINYFKVLLGEKNVIQDEDRLSSANFDWMRKYKGSSQLLLQPESTEQVSQILQYCNSRRLAVVPQGGNTGLVGGSVPVFDEVIINLGCMSHTISFDKVSGILVCEAGCILENLDSFLVNEGKKMS